MASSNTIGIGLVGAGMWGETHALVYSRHPKATVVAVADADPARAEGLARKYGAKRWYGRIDALVEDPEVDAIAVATPDFAHRDPIVLAARFGKSVLVEKPLATTADDLDAIERAVKSSGIKVMVDFHNRWNPPIALARESIERGELGEIVSAYYRLSDTLYVPTEMLSWARYSSPLWFLGPHIVDTVCWLIGDEVARVYAVSRSKVLVKRGIDCPDIYQAILEFRGGAIASIETSWIVPNSHPNINDHKASVIGTKGMIALDLSNNSTIVRFTEHDVENPDFLVMPVIHGEPAGFAYQSIRHFVDRLADGRPFLASFEDGIKVSRILLAIAESAESGKPVDLGAPKGGER